MAATLEQTVEQLTRQAAGRFYGKYRGTVTDVSDPDNNGRIMAQVPSVMGETAVGWALPAFPFAGDGHGLVMLPEVGAMVWIEFEAGNLDHPIWSGGFFLPGQRPSPDSNGARIIVSKSGHKLLLDDDAGTVTLEHSGGAKIEMSATELSISIGASKMVMGLAAISFNDGVVKIGPAGVSLAQGAMTLGVPPT
jgi:uncharacterized protein involved in type VI secretion and phage assembly